MTDAPKFNCHHDLHAKKESNDPILSIETCADRPQSENQASL
jgi:hypothetical protein